MTTARACWRLARSVVHILYGALLCALVFPFLTPAQRMQRVCTWSAGLLRRLCVGLESSGARQPGPVLLVANHVSWLDMLAINALGPVRFVSKSDVRGWPLLGWMVACGGTLFIERERRRDALRVVHQIAEALTQGTAVAVFPEGTTSDGHRLLPFHANLLQAAIATGVPVQALALRFSDANSSVSAAAAFVGDMTLAHSMWRVVQADGLRAEVRLLPPHRSDSLERRELAARLREQIAESLAIPA